MRDVQVWAHALGNADLEYSLKKHAVDGPLLLSITEDEVRRDLGISNNLAVRKIEQQIEKLRVGKNLPPSATAQMMLKFAHKEHANGTHLNLPPQSSDLSLAPTARRILVYRIWESMYNDPGTEVSLEPSMTAMPMFLDAVEKELKAKQSMEPAETVSHFVTRAGLSIEKVGELPDKVFVLVGQEVYFYPSDRKGERFTVPLPSDHRSVEVQVLSDTPRLVLIEGFLSPSECAAIKKEAVPKMSPSTVLAQGDQKKGEKHTKDNARTSNTAWLQDRSVPIVQKIRQRVQDLAKVPMEWAEDMQVLQYKHKQHYYVHFDYFDPKMYPGDKRWESGHNRLATVFFYLSTVEKGGETVFPYGNTAPEMRKKIHTWGPCEDALSTAIKVPAVQGSAIIFYSMKPKGHDKMAELDPTALHGGCDPIVGEKWSANYWLRNGPVQ
mmetsp:Transcript_2316/g.3713  ORF Transcript_2316/g.3713 Transcript_2316/m.3713 type:complete len:438 (-) Transcript_2316:118-1431(-)